MILVTTFAGFYLGTPGELDVVKLFQTLAGVALAAGGTLALNQFVEREVDARMQRTCRRPLPDGRLDPVKALVFGLGITTAGLLYLTLAVDLMCSAITATIVASYLLVYTPMKRKTALASVVGAVSGALPPVAGWAAAGGLQGQAWLLFLILFFWQMPHNLAIAWRCRDDYARAGMRVLPVVHPDGRSTGFHCALNCLALLGVSLIPALTGLAGAYYFFSALLFGIGFLICGVQFAVVLSERTAGRLLLASYVYLPVLLGVMVVDHTVL
jgi:protoheme IX farnesyltransferase